jgi:DNA-directed RNA polymerase subunit RPC12/RpoP
MNERKCEYCSSAISQTDLRCGNCGAPVTIEGSAPDFRTCPFCRRKLIALGSPACNYCGRRLPDEYIKAREADLNRLSEIEDGGELRQGNSRIEEFFQQASRRHKPSSAVGLLDIVSLTDLLP